MAASPLHSILTAILNDPGLKASIPDTQIQKGIDAATELNSVLLAMMDLSEVNADGRISASDMQAISDELWKDANAAPWRDFWLAHGNDNGTVVSGFHWVQNDGGTALFQGRNAIDTVIDAIYHYGFRIQDGRYFNEDGNTNETILDVAGWLNYFLNGENLVWGTDATEELGSGEYSEQFADARNETFLAGRGNDSIWADLGNDKVYGGDGNDRSGGGLGADRMWGESGNDMLGGDEGNDLVSGGGGQDVLSGGADDDLVDGGNGDDTLYGGDGKDRLFGGEGADEANGDVGYDRIDGGAGDDDLWGGDGSDQVMGGIGNDSVGGGEGTDHLRGGAGADTFQLWEMQQAADTIYFSAGDSGLSRSTIDFVQNFASGTDKLNLVALGPMTFEDIDFAGSGQASCYYDGHFLRIDLDGNRSADMIIEFAWVEALKAGDFVFA